MATYQLECDYCGRVLTYPGQLEITADGITRCKDAKECDEVWIKNNPATDDD